MHFIRLTPQIKIDESKLDSGEKETDGKLSMDFVAGLNVKRPVEHVHFGSQIVNMPTAMNEEQRNQGQDIQDQLTPKGFSNYFYSRQAQNVGSRMPHTDHASGAMKSEKFPQMVSAQQQLNEGLQRTAVGAPPQLPSGIRRGIKKLLEESLRKMGITPQFQQTNGRGNPGGLKNVLRSTARKSASSNAGNSQFTFPNLRAGSVPNAEGKQIFATIQWRAKQPPAYTSAASNDIYLWTSLVPQYSVLM